MNDARPSRSLPPLRRFGQNFLVDPEAVRRIADAVAASRGEAVLEIGPGDGVLTEAILRSGARVVAVEIDRGRAASLRERFAGASLVVVEEDARRFEFARVATLLDLPPRTPLVVAGNLPYNISKPLALRIVEERERVRLAVLMFQREVADRLVAAPGSKAYGPLSVLAGLAFSIRSAFDLPPSAFRPRPKVTSSVTVWTRRNDAPLPASGEGALREVLRASFARRRATLGRNFREVLGAEASVRILAAAGIDPRVRAERLDPGTFLRLAELWPARGAG